MGPMERNNYGAKLSCINVSQFALLGARLELKSKSFAVENLSAEAVGFLIGGGSLAYRLDLTWKLIDWRRRRTAAVPGSRHGVGGTKRSWLR